MYTVLLGIQNSCNEDLGFISSELVYGQELRLPRGLIVKSSNISNFDPSSFVAKLRKSFNSIRHIEVSIKRQKNIFIHPDL